MNLRRIFTLKSCSKDAKLITIGRLLGLIAQPPLIGAMLSSKEV